MRLEEVRQLLGARVMVGEDRLQSEVSSGFGCDLLSDSLALTESRNLLLLTGITGPQSIRTADVLDAVAVVFVRGKTPAPETIELAKEKRIPVLVTEKRMFDSCGILYQAGLRG